MCQNLGCRRMGFGLFWKEGEELQKLNMNVLLRTTNQGAYVAVKSFEAIKQRREFPKNREIIFWSDAGPHF